MLVENFEIDPHAWAWLAHFLTLKKKQIKKNCCISSRTTLSKTLKAKNIGNFPQHPKRDQNLKFTPLSETTSTPTFFIFESPLEGGYGHFLELHNDRCLQVYSVFFYYSSFLFPWKNYTEQRFMWQMALLLDANWYLLELKGNMRDTRKAKSQ